VSLVAVLFLTFSASTVASSSTAASSTGEASDELLVQQFSSSLKLQTLVAFFNSLLVWLFITKLSLQNRGAFVV
jgi:hypothetical protein